jgi:hypothetical protein
LALGSGILIANDVLDTSRSKYAPTASVPGTPTCSLWMAVPWYSISTVACLGLTPASR